MNTDLSSRFPALVTTLSESHNDKVRIFANVLNGQATSRRDLAELLSIRSTSISSYVSELLDLGFLAETTGPRSGRGRPSLILVANTNSLVTLVFHVISQSLHVVAINMAEQILCHEYTPAAKDCENQGLTEKFRFLFQKIQSQIPKTSRIAGVAFSLSGLVDRQSGEWVFSSRWPKMHSLMMADIFPDLTCPVSVSRNMDSELRARLSNEQENALLLHWGYGIGAAFGTHSGQTMTGTNGFGEVGHWHINGENSPCHCGRHGCLETVAALWSLGSVILGDRFNAGNDEVTLANQIQEIDLNSFPEMDKALNHVVIVLGNLCRVFFPHKVIVSGPVVMNPALWARFRAKFHEENTFIGLPQPELVIGSDSRRYELLGAASPIFEQSLTALLR